MDSITSHEPDSDTVTASNLYARFLEERHERHQLSRRLSCCQEECEKLRRVSESAFHELEQAGATIEKLGVALLQYAEHSASLETVSESFDEVANIVFRSTASVEDKASVYSICEKLGRSDGHTLQVTSITGLPRLRVFPDDCWIKLILSGPDQATLWTSSPIRVYESQVAPSRWESRPFEETIKVPLSILPPSGEYSLTVHFESTKVAESEPFSIKSLANRPRFTLTHNGLHIPDAFLHVSMCDESYESKPSQAQELIQIRILSISGLDIQDTIDSHDSRTSIAVIFRDSNTKDQRAVALDIGGEAGTPRTELMVSASSEREQTVHVTVQARGRVVSKGTLFLDWCRLRGSNGSSHWIPATCDLTYNGESNGTLSLEYCPSINERYVSRDA